MFAKQFLETKPWEARSQRHQNSHVIFHWAPATSYLLNATGQDQQRRKPCPVFPDGHSLFLTGIAGQARPPEVQICRTLVYSIITAVGRKRGKHAPSWNEGSEQLWGNQLSVSRGKAVGFGSLSVAAGETLKCGKVVAWWLISPKVWDSSGRVSLLPGSLVVKPSSLLGTRIKLGPVEPWGFNLNLPSLERGTSQPEGSMFELCSPSQSIEEPNRTLPSKLSFPFKQKTTKRACPVSDRRNHTNQDQSKVSKKQNVLFPGGLSYKTIHPGPFLHKTLENMSFYNYKWSIDSTLV